MSSPSLVQRVSGQLGPRLEDGLDQHQEGSCGEGLGRGQGEGGEVGRTVAINLCWIQGPGCLGTAWRGGDSHLQSAVEEKCCGPVLGVVDGGLHHHQVIPQGHHGNVEGLPDTLL